MASESAADTRECDASLQFDVDVLILDYLVYNALQAVLQHASTTRSQTRLNESAEAHQPELPFEITNGLGMVDSFLQVFASAHGSSEQPRTLHFRLRLLRFTTLFVLRHTENVSTPSFPTLAALRKENDERANTWLANAGADAFPLPLVQWFKDSEQLGDAPLPHSEESDGSNLPSLLDILPLFVEITAARSNDGECMVGTPWFILAAELMLQAALEQYLNLQRHGPQPVMEAFAWGFEGIASASNINNYKKGEADSASTETNTHDFMTIESNKINENIESIFCELEPLSTKSTSSLLRVKLNSTWADIRREFLEKLLPKPDLEGLNSSRDAPFDTTENASKTLKHLHHVAAAHPLPAFEDGLLVFLNGMNESVAKPILTQLELADAARDTENEDDIIFEIDDDFDRIEIGGNEARQLMAQVRRLR